uniref:Aldehyde reductase-3 n=1 Tax=Plutella xylostella TaxID=51655 RepID=A0A1L8D6P6_PLUXY
MEAVVFDGKALSLKYVKDFPVPKIVNDNDVIVKVAYSGVCGTDLHIIQGEFPALKERPLPLGHEFSGTVHEAGKKCQLKRGQRVVVDPNRACGLCDFCRKGNYQYCLTDGINSTVGIFKDGGWAQYVKVPMEQVYALPDNISLEQAGLCEPYACVAHGFNRAAPIPVGSRVLVLGAGIIGNLWITTLHLQGHRDVTVSEMNQTRLDIVKKLKTDFRLVTPDVLEKETLQYDIIIDCTGVGVVVEKSMKYLSPGGKYVVFGCCPPTHKASINPFDLYNKELTIIGVKINPYTFPTAIGWLAALGTRYLEYKNLGIKTFKLSEYKKALDELKTGAISKAIFKID